eukprot:664192-Alexandrium_andersonii.AAC.1
MGAGYEHVGEGSVTRVESVRRPCHCGRLALRALVGPVRGASLGPLRAASRRTPHYGRERSDRATWGAASRGLEL